MTSVLHKENATCSPEQQRMGHRLNLGSGQNVLNSPFVCSFNLSLVISSYNHVAPHGALRIFILTVVQFSSVQFSHSVVSNSLWPHELQHVRPPCPSPTPRVHSDSRPSSQWCHPAISSSVVPFSSCPNPSQHQSLFQWVNSSHEVAKVLEFQL